MKLIAPLFFLLLILSCAPTDNGNDNSVASIDADPSTISDEILVIDSFYADTESEAENKMTDEEKEKYLRSLLPVGTTFHANHFDFTSDMSYDFTETWAEYIEGAFEAMSKIYEPIIKENSSIFVFRNKDRYQDYARILAPENVNTRGYYDPKYRLIVSYYDNNPEKLKRTLLHECTHVVLRNYIGHNCIPPWVDEGLACTYESGNYVNGAWQFGIPRMNFIKYLIVLLRKYNINPFKQLMSIGWRKFISGSSQNVEINYLLSWSLVYYFLHYKNGVKKKLFIEFLHKLRETKDPEMKYPFIYDNYINPNEKEFLRTWQEFIYSLD